MTLATYIDVALHHKAACLAESRCSDAGDMSMHSDSAGAYCIFLTAP